MLKINNQLFLYNNLSHFVLFLMIKKIIGLINIVILWDQMMNIIYVNAHNLDIMLLLSKKKLKKKNF